MAATRHHWRWLWTGLFFLKRPARASDLKCFHGYIDKEDDKRSVTRKRRLVLEFDTITK